MQYVSKSKPCRTIHLLKTATERNYNVAGGSIDLRSLGILIELSAPFITTTDHTFVNPSPAQQEANPSADEAWFEQPNLGISCGS